MSKAGINQRLRLCSIAGPLRTEIQTSEPPVAAYVLLEIAKIKDSKEQLRIWRRLRDDERLTVRAVKDARKRGSYEKRYRDYNIDENGVKIMIRWDLDEADRSTTEALKLAQDLIKEHLKMRLSIQTSEHG